MKSLVVLSDLHVGSNFAVMPRKTFCSEGDRWVTPNTLQEDLIGLYEGLVEEWKAPDILVLNGDLMDGKGQKNFGNTVWSGNFDDQIEACETLVDMWGAKKIYVVRGSEYHMSRQGDPAEEALAKRVGAEPIGSTLSAYELFLKVEGVTFHFAHHLASTRVFQYRATALAREIAMGLLNASHKHKTDVVVRSHVHYAWETGSPNHLGFTTPAWQVQTPYMSKLSPSGAIPDIGGLRFTVDGDGFDWQWRLFKARKPELITVMA